MENKINEAQNIEKQPTKTTRSSDFDQICKIISLILLFVLVIGIFQLNDSIKKVSNEIGRIYLHTPSSIAVDIKNPVVVENNVKNCKNGWCTKDSFRVSY